MIALLIIIVIVYLFLGLWVALATKWMSDDDMPWYMILLFTVAWLWIIIEAIRDKKP